MECARKDERGEEAAVVGAASSLHRELQQLKTRRSFDRSLEEGTMKRSLLVVTVLTVLAGAGWVAAQTTPAPKPPATSPAPRGGMGMMGGGGGYGMMGGGMMGPGMMGGGMMGGGMCPGVIGGANTKIEVKKIDKGVTITMTSPDAPTAARLQKMAEAMRLMHEAMAQ
jgi:hypothetical protein